MPTPTRIRSEAGDENQSPIHFPRVALSVLSFIARIDATHSSTLPLICHCDGQRGTLNISRSNPRRINRLRVRTRLVTSKTRYRTTADSLEVIENMERERGFEPPTSSLGI